MIKKLFKWSARLLIVAWFIFTMIIGMWLWKENSAPVVVRYFGFEYQDWTLGTIMTAMLVLGFVFGSIPLFFTSLLKEGKHRMQVRKIRKELTHSPSNSQAHGQVKAEG
ncbi:MAG: LapA family protein [Agarilytica sp.]